MNQPAVLVLEEGSFFKGKAIGGVGKECCTAVGEVVFNTAMTGYQEILTDPSYANQLITLTYPHIGNVGINTEDLESNRIHARGLIIRELPLLASNWRQEQSLDEFLKMHGTIGIQKIDTRRLTRLLRQKGTLRGCIIACDVITEDKIQHALELACKTPALKGCDLAKKVSTQQSYVWHEGGTWFKQVSKKTNNLLHIVAYDFGIKKSILRVLDDLHCRITVVPAQTKADEVFDLNPDGVFLSNGPGDPEPCDYAIEAIQHFLQAKLPVFGICLGYQLLALALGGKTYKMKFGHHGGNHPVIDLADNQVIITSQNHGFAVDELSLKQVTLTHRSLFDGTLQGFQHQTLPAYGFQGHPEAGPGPNDALALFQPFMTAMRQHTIQPKQPVTAEI